ncbi:MAG TPA: hypothetical protein VMK16_04875 [Acidimicrobiales bacterium]|nr:hypothetical protein [Acidimicrobiales bacterium]
MRDHKATANRLIAYHAPIAQALSAERTSLESKLIPVTAYVITACVESWYRYPEMIRAIDKAMPAEEIGLVGRRPGTRINTVHLWGVPNFWLLGRKVVMGMGAGLDDPEAAYTVLDFWERAVLAFRGDGTMQAWDTDDVRPYEGAVAAELLDGTAAVDDAQRSRIKKLNATLVGYEFLMWFDTRSGAQDTGPYAVPGHDGQVMLVRDFSQLGRSDFWWSDVAADVPYTNLTAALVLDDVRFRVTDFGTSYTTPEDYLDRVVRFGLFTTDAESGELRIVPSGEIEAIVTAVRKAQSAHYRNIASMDRHEKIRCGAYVYFSFLRPFALAAGIADDLDWELPRDIPQPLYDFVSQLEGTNTANTDDGPYYDLIP